MAADDRMMSPASIWVDDRQIGEDDPVYIIAEIGGNHDGSIARARDLIIAAATAGADAAKFQFYRDDQLYLSALQAAL